ncbi:MAG: ATP-binding protein [Candidatus Limnocylindrales bacterium]
MTDVQADAESTRPAADATPAKHFFIYMLVKDIELIPSVVDLVDNSVDAARVLLARGRNGEPSAQASALGQADDTPAAGGLPDLSQFLVEIEANADRFEIRDNCGGIDLDTAEKYAFRFGRPEDFPGSPLAVGQFGVGMKRALFKLGTKFTVTSTTERSHFVLPVDVEAWALDQDPRWRFPFSVADPDYHPTAGETGGTTIAVHRLHESVSEDFASPGILGRLRTDLELRHQPPLDAGMQIHLNGDPLRASRPELALSDLISPVHVAETIAANGGSVRMDLYAGIVAPKDGGHIEDLEPEELSYAPQAGWYLFCNNRLLLAADTSALTGWGDGASAYHPQYRNFRGYVYLYGDSALLPWNTTKTGVDRDSRVFRITKAQMTTALRSVQGFLNKAKNEGQQVPEEDRVLAPAIAKAQQVALAEIPLSQVMKYPEPVQRTAEDTIKRIAYAVARDDFDAVADALETDSAPKVGRRTFQFFLETQVER